VGIRLLSYNVRSLRDDAAAVAQVIRACAPDVACIQEAPRLLGWRSRCAGLARRSGLLVVTGGRTAAGNLILAHQRTQVREAATARFPWMLGKHQRGMAMAVLDIGSARLGVASVHMSLYADERARHLPLALERLSQLAAPHLVLAGDINERPGDKVWKGLAHAYRDAYAIAPHGGEFTSTSRVPIQRIDGVFVSGRIEVVGCGVPDLPGLPDLAKASDHLPVLAVLRVPARAAADRPGQPIRSNQPNSTSASE
jgi:endonuclease/exonuclease/phosphatase family metal-dependent hydrolase